MRLYRKKDEAVFVLLDEGTDTPTLKQLATYRALYGVGEVLCRPLDTTMTPIQISDLTESEMDILARYEGRANLGDTN
jgi:hypothetical protein